MRSTVLLFTLIFFLGIISVFSESDALIQDSAYNKSQTALQKDSLISEESFKTAETDDDFNIFIGIIFLVVIFGASGLGAGLLTIGLFIVAGLITAGVLSSSIIVGLYNRSFEKGFMFFIVGLPAAAGSLIGIIIFFILNKIMDWWSDFTAVISGGIVGCISGALFGFLAFFILQKLTSFLVKYFHAEQN